MRALRLAPLFALFVAALGYAAWSSARLIGEPFPGFFYWSNGYLVALHASDWSGPEAELPLNGGRLVAVDGAPFAGADAVARALRAEPIGASHRYTVRFEGREREFQVPSARFGALDHALSLGIYWISALSFFAIACIALLLKPNEPGPVALALACAGIGFQICFAIDYVTAHRVVPLYLAAEALTPALTFNFALNFPLRRFPRPLVYGAIAALAALGLALGALNYRGFHSDPERSRAITQILGTLLGAGGIAAGLSFLHAFFRARNPRVRRQAAVVLFGGLLALTVPALLMVGFFTLGWVISFGWILLAMPIFPAVVLYSIVAQDLFRIERLARVTTGYVVATATLALVYALVVFAVERFFQPGALTNPVFSLVLLLGFAVAFEPLRHRIETLIDRAFYRSALDSAAVLERIGVELAGARSVSVAIERVEEAAREALQVEWVRFDDGAQSQAGELRATVRFRDRELGSLQCGAKRSGRGFSEAEREVFRGLASQLALGLESVRAFESLERAQELLVRSERLAAIGEFAGAMAHGLRNPLAGIRATLELALEDGDAGDGVLHGVLSDLDRVEHRIQTLLDFSKPFDPTLRRVDLRQVVGHVVAAVRTRGERDGVRIETEFPNRPVFAEIDPDYLEEALLELVGNAFRALESGGAIHLELDETGPWSRVRVRDSGPGIPEALRDRVFELFFTTREHGTGLGLATVRKIVSRMGGRVSLESAAGEGCVFEILLRDGAAPQRQGEER